MTTPTLPPPPSVLDPDQLARIEATHRGFFYQHLYTVACLLLAPSAGVYEILVERDEDLELRSDGTHVYVQVKTRSGPLQPNDIEGALERFDTLRAQHAQPPSTSAAVGSPVSKRSGTPLFVIVANVPPGPALAKAISDTTWPADVKLAWPGCAGTLPPEVAPAWPTVREAIVWCGERAATVPYTRVAPFTLVLKLAALVQAAAMGGVDGLAAAHTFAIALLPQLFEQVVRAVQQLPEAPDPYWPQADEPEPTSDAPVRLIVGPSGSGKTAWASVRALHDARPAAYFSAAGLLGAGFASALAQELAARFVGGNPEELGSVLMPGATGLDGLRALALVLRQKSIRPVIAIDDVQQLQPEDVRRVSEAAPDFGWVLLAHPGPTVSQLEARLGIKSEALKGWSLDTIAAVLSEAGCIADAPTCNRVRLLTGGLPLFVRNLSQLAQRQHNGNVAALCTALERGKHLEATAQEALLQDTLSALSPSARRVADVLGVTRVAVNLDEVEQLARPLGLDSAATGRAVRELNSWGVSRGLGEGRLRLHDAFRLLCGESSGSITGAELVDVQRELCTLLDPSESPYSFERAVRYLELLPAVGDTERLIEIASNETEVLYERGLAAHVQDIVQRTSEDPAVAAEGRFWALDALTYWDLQQDRIGDAATRLSRQEQLANEHGLGGRALVALHMKRLQLSARTRDLDGAEISYRHLLDASGGDDVLGRIARYNYAVALFLAGAEARAARVAWDLVLEYFDELGLEMKDVFGKNAPEVAARLPTREGIMNEVKRLADTLDLFARAKVANGEEYGLAKIHAFKFYTICHAYQSAIKTGQDVADDMLRMGTPDDARVFMERTLIPAMDALQLVDYVVPVRGQYAVVLAYCGRIGAARAEMRRLLAFGSSSPARQTELNGQASLIEKIASGHVFIEAQPSVASADSTGLLLLKNPPGRPGRNDPCMCGSGKKFKRCCGK